MKTNSKPRLALWFRYGPAEHSELFHAIPDIVRSLAHNCEVHYYGLRSPKPVPGEITRNAVVHHLPFRINRSSQRDKLLKTALWIAALPFIGLSCRLNRTTAVYIDETVPLTAALARLFFGRRVAFTVADFFMDIYADRRPLLRPVAAVVRRLDLAAWRKLPLIFTRARATADYLAAHGVPREHIHPVYDPCDLKIYHPLPEEERRTTRRRLGLQPSDIVLAHHGILHPNKGNDRILRVLARLRQKLPSLRYLIIGDGPEMPRLRHLAAELNLEGTVVFTGWLKTIREVNQALNAADIGLAMRIGQQADNFHVTGALVHSLACGLPVLAARLAGMSEIISDGENGLLFDPADMEDFAGQLQRLAADPELRRRLGCAGLETARRLFDMHEVTRATVTPLLQLAGVSPEDLE